MVPARQPKSLLRALKGSIIGAAATAEGGEGKPESHMLESERAKSQLATAVTSRDESGTFRGGVRSTRLLGKESFSATIKEE